MPASMTGITTPLTLQAYPRMLGLGPLWFVVMLFVFNLGYAVWRMVAGNRTASTTSTSSGPGYLGIGIFVLALAVASYLMRMVVPLGSSVWEFPTLAYLPQYLSFFVVGIIASRRDWFRTLSGAKGAVGIVAAVVASVVLFPLAFSGQMFSLEVTPAVDNCDG